MILTAYYTGLREGELLGLRWEYIDLDNGIIYLPSTMTLKDPTGRRQRVIMQKELIDLFKSLSNHSERVFCQEDGKPLRHWHYYGPFQKIIKAMGKGDGWTFHTLRHTTGTHLYLKGASPIAIKDQLRHSDIRVTINYYVGTDLDHQKELLEKLTPTIWQNASA